MMSKAIHAHITHFHAAQMMRQWLISARSMTTQNLHKQHDIRLKMDQQLRAIERARGVVDVPEEEHHAPQPQQQPAPVSHMRAAPHRIPQPKKEMTYPSTSHLHHMPAPVAPAA